MMRNQTTGFSLVELMVTVTVLAILIGIGVPMFSEGIALNRVRSASLDMYGTLTRARSEAIARNTTVDVTQTVSGSEGWSQGWSTTASLVVIDKKDVAGGVKITGPEEKVSFNYSGRAATGATSFEIISTKYESIVRCVTLDLSGRPFVKNTGC